MSTRSLGRRRDQHLHGNRAAIDLVQPVMQGKARAAVIVGIAATELAGFK